MNHHQVLCVNKHVLLLKPEQQLGAIRGREKLPCGAAAFVDLPAGVRQYSQVMIAQYAPKVSAVLPQKTQGAQRIWAPVDQVPTKPQLIVFANGEAGKQGVKAVTAPLKVTNDKSAHASIIDLV